MTLVDLIFFFYIFVGLYLTSFMVIVFFLNKKRLFQYPESKEENVSFVVPCYNAEKSIGKVIESIYDLDYPKNKIEVIVVDDCSKDNTREVVESYMSKYSSLRLIKNRANSGGAAEPTNLGIKAAKYDYVAVVDDDSMPEKSSLRKMLGFLQQDKKVGAVTCSILVRHPTTFMQKLQSIEYSIIAWTRKLLDFVDSVYVTPGPLALYRKDKLLEVGLFDTENMTQDIEIAWRLMSHGYQARMCLDAAVYTDAPKKLKAWWRQRVRWTIGGIQTLFKYKSFIFRKGMLGFFVIPFFAFSLLLGLLGFGIFAYVFIRRFFILYLSSYYSLSGGAAIVHLQDFSFSPSVLNYFGFTLFFIGVIFTLLGLGIMRKKKQGKTDVLTVGFYIVIYLTLLPLVMLYSVYKMLRGNYSW